MNVTFELTRDEVARWQRWEFLSRRAGLAVVAVVAVAVLGSAETVFEELRAGNWLAAIGWVLLPLLTMSAALLALLATDARASRLMARDPELKAARTFEFSPEGYRWSIASRGASEMWAMTGDTVETPSLLLLNGGLRTLDIVPKRALSAERLTELRGYLRAAQRGPRAAGWPGQWS
jgi:hypothetical protein